MGIPGMKVLSISSLVHRDFLFLFWGGAELSDMKMNATNKFFISNSNFLLTLHYSCSGYSEGWKPVWALADTINSESK